MFKVGKQYEITTGYGDEIGHSVATVVEVDLPLIKVQRFGSVEILNTHAPTFHSAKPVQAAETGAFDEF